MPTPIRTKPVQDDIPKVNNELAVGEDLEFQHRWWRFENIVWSSFALILLLDFLGLFGRGPLAKAHMRSTDGAMKVDYERVERFSTPSVMRVSFGPAAVRDGKIEFWVSESIIKELGAQRISPQPASSILSQGGILYTWPATDHPASAAFALEPSGPGVKRMSVELPQIGDQLSARIFVMP